MKYKTIKISIYEEGDYVQIPHDGNVGIVVQDKLSKFEDWDSLLRFEDYQVEIKIKHREISSYYNREEVYLISKEFYDTY